MLSRTIRFLVIFGFFVLFGTSSIKAEDRVVILHTNDMHGQLLPRKSSSGTSGGFAGLQKIVSEVRNEVGADHVLLLDAGDWFQGTPEGAEDGGLHIIRAMEVLGFDATTLGNHDFDYGIDNLIRLIQSTEIPVLASNVSVAGDRLKSVTLSEHVIERGGFQIGLIGILTPDAPNIIAASVGKQLTVAPLVSVVTASRDRLRSAGADLIVVLSHSGVEHERVLSTEVSGIDLIVGGHSHTLVDPPWVDPTNKTVVAQVGAKTRHVGRVEFRRNGDGVEVTSSVISVESVNDSENSDLKDLISAVESTVGQKMNRKVGRSPVALETAGHKEDGAVSSALGRWICHAMAQAADVEVAFHNHGGIRDSLPEGEVLYRDLFEISPFGNRVAVVTLNGKQLKALVQKSITVHGRGLDFHGARIDLLTDPSGKTEVDEIRVGDQIVGDRQEIRIATNDYLSTGGDDWGLLAAAPQADGGMSVLAATEHALQQANSDELILASISERVYFQSESESAEESSSVFNRIRSFIGLLVLLGICWLLSTSRKEVRWRTIYWGIGLQLILAWWILRTSYGYSFTNGAKEVFKGILDYSIDGTSFVFGGLADGSVGGAGFQLWIILIGTIIFVSALMAIFYHIGLLQLVVWAIARVMQWTMKTSGPESLAAAANIFAGQTEAPLVIRPYLKKMSDSEVMALMTGGMATVAGSVFAAYVGMGIDAGHLLAASFMSAPAALVAAKLLNPEKKEVGDPSAAKLEIHRTDSNVLDAACRGTSEGLILALNVIAMLVAFVAIVALVNAGLGWITQHVSYWTMSIFSSSEVSLETSPWFNLTDLLGWVFYPFAWLLGVDMKDVSTVATLIGTKTVLNEFMAFLKLSSLETPITERSKTLATYALCGFANFASVAIQIGGISSLEPQLRPRLSALGMRALIGGTVAALMTGCVAGILLP